MKKFGANREQIIELLEHEGGVTEEAVRKVSAETGVPEADIWGAGMFYSLINKPGRRVRVCDGLTCQMLGADELTKQLEDSGKQVERVICLGQCDRAPATLDEDMELVTYGNQTHITPNNPELPMNLGGQDDQSYSMLAKARELGPDKVIEEIKEAGLQGRGGAGFPAHFKWNSVRQQVDKERYVICNADESEPGTFKDREVILRRPHLILEGLAIAAEVIQAKDIFIYIRGEFTNEIRSMEKAIEESREMLGDVAVHIAKGHGAYICGEETALLESLEGKRGMPRLKPPYPTEQGFRNKPTLMHNVETIACVPSIVRRGGQWFKDQGAKLSLGDSPAFGSTHSVLSQLNLLDPLKKLGVEIVDFDSTRSVLLPSGIRVGMSAHALDCDMLINIPRIKAHAQMRVTMAVKNFFGCVVGMRKPVWHMIHGGRHGNFSHLLLELLSVLPESLTIVDGIEVMHASGPIKGRKYNLGIIGASQNPVAVDTAFLHVLAVKPETVPLWIASSEIGLVGTVQENFQFPLLAAKDLQTYGFQVPQDLSSIRFNPFRFIKNSVRRAILKVLPR